MDILPLGDSALLVRLQHDFASDPAMALRAVADVTRRLNAGAVAGVIESAPAYTSVGVFFDARQAADAGVPANAVFEWFAAEIRAALTDSAELPQSSDEDRTVEVPVCYEAEFAPDLDHVAQHSNLSAADVVRLHAEADYTVACIGFMPGFPYLAGLPPQLAIPRRKTPRKEVPRGSVAIGGAQTGIYPAPSPGGWNIIGRTPMRLFDAARVDPSTLRAGDRVRFRSISRDEFEER
jgi:inhibitor of KinA